MFKLENTRLPWKLSAVGFVLVYLLTLAINAGFMGTDEYWTGITRYVPAQTQTYTNMLKEDDVKSPSQMIPLVWAAHRALDLGYKAPYDQYRFVQWVFGLLGLLILFFCLYRDDQNENQDERRLWLFLTFTFYGAAPFAFTRPMYESLSAPYFLLSALSLRRYLKFPSQIREIWISTVAISLAFCFRPQAGIAALALPLFLLARKDWKAFITSSLIGAGGFIALGFTDTWIRGSWHHSLKSILFYNVQHGASYGQQPWYFYILLSVLLLWIPFWISRKFPVILKRNWPEHKVFWVYIVLILGLHSLFPQKWERFVIPALPLIVWIVADWARTFWQMGAWRRVFAVTAVNLLLWVPASFFPAQQNIIQVSLYLNKHPEVKTLFRLNRNPEWITEAFIIRQDWTWNDIQQPPTHLECSDRLIMNQNDYEKWAGTLNLKLERVFQTNWLEKIAYKMNPSKNIRRTPLYLLRGQGC